MNKETFFKMAWAGKEPSVIQIKKDEIVAEYDDCTREEGLMFSRETLGKLKQDGYRAIMYDHKGKSPHIHIENINGLSDLKDEVRLRYKEAFLKKYSVDDRIDISLAATKKLIAAPNQLHYKIKLEGKHYGIKKEIEVINDLEGNDIDKVLLNKVLKEKIVYSDGDGSGGIVDVAISFGLKVKKNKIICPFHKDTDASLTLYPKTNSFFCFGCKRNGDLQWFIKIVKELNNKGKDKKKINIFLKSFLNTADRFIKEQPLYYDQAKMWWFWNFKEYRWEMIDEIDIMNKFDDSEQGNYFDTIKSNIKNEIIESLKRVSRKNKPKENKKTWIQFKDIIIDFETGEHFEATPKYFITNPIPYSIGKSEDTPMMDKFFKDWVGADYVQTLYEIVSYCACTEQFLQTIIALTGAGSNGKGTYLQLLSKILGKDNVSSSELKILATKNFETSCLYRKLICMVGEVSATDLKSTNLIKSLSGQDLIRYEFKGKTPFSDYSATTIIIATNSLPMTPDKSIGFYRRWLIIDFPNQFKIKRDILSIIPEIEYNNLCKKMIRILGELCIKNKFTNEGTIEEKSKKYEERSNPIISFLDEFTEDSVGDMIKIKDFMNIFNVFLKEKHLRPMTIRQVGKILREEGYEIKPRNITILGITISSQVILNLEFNINITTKTTKTTKVISQYIHSKLSENPSSFSSFSSPKIEEIKVG